MTNKMQKPNMFGQVKSVFLTQPLSLTQLQNLHSFVGKTNVEYVQQNDNRWRLAFPKNQKVPVYTRLQNWGIKYSNE